MNYRRMRNKKGISLYTMAKELGISKEKYKEVENGLRNLEGNLIDKFCEVLENSKDINFNRLQKLVDVNIWIDSLDIEADMHKMGYDDKLLAEALNITTTSIRNIKNNYKVSDDLKEEVYDFLKNPMNKIIKKVEKKNEPSNDKLIVTDMIVEIPKNKIALIEEKNNLNYLNNMLFEELERLNNTSESELNKEINRANSMSKIASQIINNAHLGLRAVELKHTLDLSKQEMPKALINGNDNE